MPLLLPCPRPAFLLPLSASASPSRRRSASAPGGRRAAKRGRAGSSRHARQAAASKWARVQPPPPPPPPPAASPAAPRVRPSDVRPESCPALVLNADFSPLSYMPLSLWPWQDVVKAVFLDRVTVVATYDVGVRSPGMIFPLPSVISLKQYQPMAVKRPAFTRFNVFMRDGFSCQYCGQRFATQELTFDHVVPRCLNGKTNWENVVTACIACNHRKGRHLLSDLKGINLKRLPAEPSNAQLQNMARNFPPRYLHESWRDYVYWSQSMHVEEDK